jgi:hypothetical protein
MPRHDGRYQWRMNVMFPWAIFSVEMAIKGTLKSVKAVVKEINESFTKM